MNLDAIALYCTFLLGCMGTWGVVHVWQRHTQVDVQVLAAISGFGLFAFFYGGSIALLVLYGRKTEADNA